MAVAIGLSAQVLWKSQHKFALAEDKARKDAEKKAGKDRNGSLRCWAHANLGQPSSCFSKRIWVSQLLGIAGAALICDSASAIPMVMLWQPETIISSTQTSADVSSSMESILARQLALRFREMSDEELIEVLEQLLHASRASSILSQAEALKMNSVDNELQKVHAEDHRSDQGRDVQATLLSNASGVNSNKGGDLITEKLKGDKADLDMKSETSEGSGSQTSLAAEVQKEDIPSGSGSVKNEEVDMTDLLLDGWSKRLQELQKAQLQGDRGDTEKSFKLSSRHSEGARSLIDMVIGIKFGMLSMLQQVNNRLEQNSSLFYVMTIGFVLMIPFCKSIIIPKVAKMMGTDENMSGWKKNQRRDEESVKGSIRPKQTIGKDAKLSNTLFSLKSMGAVASIFGSCKDSLKISRNVMFSILSTTSGRFNKYSNFSWFLQRWKVPTFLDNSSEGAVPQKGSLLRQQSASAPLTKAHGRLNSESYSSSIPFNNSILNDSTQKISAGYIYSDVEGTDELQTTSSRLENTGSNAVDVVFNGEGLKTVSSHRINDLQSRQKNVMLSSNDPLKLNGRDDFELEHSVLNTTGQDYLGLSSAPREQSNEAVPRLIDIQRKSGFREKSSINFEAGKKSMQSEVVTTAPPVEEVNADLQHQDAITSGKAESWDRVVHASQDWRFDTDEVKKALGEQILDVRSIGKSELQCTFQGTSLDWFQHGGSLWVRDADGVFVQQGNVYNNLYSLMGSKEKYEDRFNVGHAKVKRERNEPSQSQNNVCGREKESFSRSVSFKSKQEVRSRLATAKSFDYRQLVLQIQKEYEEQEEATSPKGF